MARAIYETRDRQLIPLDDIQHINARPNEAIREGFETLTIIYKEGMKMTLPICEYEIRYCFKASHYERDH